MGLDRTLFNHPRGPRSRSIIGSLLIFVVIGSLLLMTASVPLWAAPAAMPNAQPTIVLGGTVTPEVPTEAPVISLTQLAWAPDGSALAAATSGGVLLYEPGASQSSRTVDAGTPVSAVAYSPDGTTLAVGTFQGAVRLWRVSEASMVLALTPGGGPVSALAFAPNGQFIAAAGWDGVVRIWRVSDGAPHLSLAGHAGRVTGLAYSPDGAVLASSAGDGTVRLWRTTDGSLARAVRVGQGEVSALAIARNGAVFAAGSGDGAIRLYRTRDASLVRTLSGHQGWVSALSFSPAGDALASSSADATVRLWRGTDGAAITSIPGQMGPLAATAFSPDASLLAVGAMDGKVQFWPVKIAAAPPTLPPGPTVVIAPPTSTAVPPLACINNAAFVGDVTVPDNTVFLPGETFNKTWRVRNTGTCAWGPGYRLVFVGGEALGAPPNVGVVLTGPGAMTDISVAMQAPPVPGQYSSAWQLMSPNGTFFGPTLTVVIQVQPPAPVPTSTPVGPPPLTVSITADKTTVAAGSCTTVRASVEGVAAAWLDGEPIVGGYKEKKVCPCVDTTYVLQAVKVGGGTVTKTVTVKVTGVCLIPMTLIPKPKITLIPMTLIPKPKITLIPMTLIPITPGP